MSDYDGTIESIITDIVEREVRKEVDRLAAMEKVPVYVPGTPGATGPKGIDGKDCDEERLDDIEKRLRALEKGDTPTDKTPLE